MKILISAAERSSDAHGAELMRALKKEFSSPEKSDGKIEFFGIGGPLLEAEGLRIVFDARNLLVMGFSEIIFHLPKIYRALRETTLAARELKPDIAVVIDYPDFHFRLAKRLKKIGIPVVYYIPPKVWAWRKGRVSLLRRYFTKILAIFPFEVAFYEKENINVKYVGNPLVDELPWQLTQEEARKALSLKDKDRVLVLMPGSRPAEIRSHFKLMLDSARKAAEDMKQTFKVLIPFPPLTPLTALQVELEAWLKTVPSGLLDVQLSQGNSHICLVAADAGLIKSGTSTLEAGLLGCCHSIIYKPSRTTEWIFKNLIRYQGPVGMVNLVIGWEPNQALQVSEILFQTVNVDFLAAEIQSLMTDMDRRNQLKSYSEKIRNAMIPVGQPNTSPSVLAAREILASARTVPLLLKQEPFIRKIFISLGSVLWSNATKLSRWGLKKGFYQPVRLDSRVISIGNLQSGGAGKTPLVAFLANEAVKKGLRVCILTRGYRSRWEHSGGVLSPGDFSVSPNECGDEALLLQTLCKNVFIGVGRDRVRQYREIVEKFNYRPDLVILDDGFQNRQLVKDLEIVAVTSARSSQTLFREHWSALDYAHLIVWTKGELTQDFRTMISKKPAVRVQYELSAPLNAPLNESVTNSPLWLITGIADGSSAHQLALKSGYKIVKHTAYEDHVHYELLAVQKVLKEAESLKIQVALTGKDWVKWKSLGVAIEKVVILEPQLNMIEGRDIWEKVVWGH